ncbi:RNA-binding cell elongation regulator Jag/EloR [Salinicoccus sp. HZC-1]|uniref:RNA-binding cell elongation regulator Jag/EloR n=1 Tax=Salinicoccus sp. HZC-1 TaxID=3385497 RepID=UPI00398AFD6D
MYKVYKEKTVDTAIAKGLEELKVSESDIKIDVEDEGKRGIFGFGQRDAEVKLTVINPELKMYESVEALIARDVEKEDSIVAQEEPEEEVSGFVSTMEETGEETSEDEVAEPAEKAQEKKRQHDNQEAVKKAADETKHYLNRVITDMNIENSSEIVIDHNEIRINIESPTAAKLIGKRGATLNALQEVAQNYFNSIYRSYGIIILDVEDYREKRKETLENLAVNMSKKVLRTNEPVKLEPMPSFERKIMHHVLSDMDDVETYSEGSEPNRYLVIEKK